MLNLIKWLLQKLSDLLINISKEFDPVKETSLKDVLEKHPNYEKHPMSETPDLLSSIEKVIRNDFCVLKTSDTLSDALALVTLQKAGDILIVDNNGKFAGSISDISVLSQVPPQVSDIPIRYQIKLSSIRKQVNDSLVSTIKKTIGDVFQLKKVTRRFSKDGYLIYPLEELAKPYKNSAAPKIVPILNNDETIAGVVSYQGILEFIRIDPFWVETKVEKLLSVKLAVENIYKLLPEDTLDKAYFAMDYLPINFILICDDNNNLLGMVDRHQISALAHPLYFHLMDMPLSEIMKPVESLSLVESSQTMKGIIDSFLDLGITVAIAVEISGSKVHPKSVITPANLIQVYLQNFRSTTS